MASLSVSGFAERCFEAASSGDIQALVSLLSNADSFHLIRAGGGMSVTPAQIATINGRLEALRVLVSKLGTVCLVDRGDEGQNCAHYACMYGHLDIIEYLHDTMGKDFLASGDYGGFTPALEVCDAAVLCHQS